MPVQDQDAKTKGSQRQLIRTTDTYDRALYNLGLFGTLGSVSMNMGTSPPAHFFAPMEKDQQEKLPRQLELLKRHSPLGRLRILFLHILQHYGCVSPVRVRCPVVKYDTDAWFWEVMETGSVVGNRGRDKGSKR